LFNELQNAENAKKRGDKDVTSIPEDKQNQGEGSDVARWASLISGNGAVGTKATFFTWCFNSDRGGTLAYQAAKSKASLKH